jgi:hypothetical protein
VPPIACANDEHVALLAENRDLAIAASTTIDVVLQPKVLEQLLGWSEPAGERESLDPSPTSS